MIMKVSNVDNSVNFKAKVNIKIDDDFIYTFGIRKPKYLSEFVEEATAAVRLLKEIAPKIGTDKDVIELRSYKGRELDLMYNGGFCGMIGDSDEKPFEGMIICLKLLANRLNPGNNLLLNYRSSVRESFASSLFNGPKAQGIVTQKKPRHKNPGIFRYSDRSGTINITECQQKLRVLNQIEA